MGNRRMWYLDLEKRHVYDESVDPDWFEHSSDCPMSCGNGCGGVRPELYGRPVVTRLTREPRASIAWAPMAEVVAMDLADAVAPYLPTHYRGIVLLPGGIRSTRFTNWYVPAPLRAFLAGPSGTRHRRCRYCKARHIGRPSKDPKQPWIDASSLAEDQRASMIDGSFVVDTGIRTMLEDRRILRGIQFLEMEVA